MLSVLQSRFHSRLGHSQRSLKVYPMLSVLQSSFHSRLGHSQRSLKVYPMLSVLQSSFHFRLGHSQRSLKVYSILSVYWYLTVGFILDFENSLVINCWGVLNKWVLNKVWKSLNDELINCKSDPSSGTMTP
jgi:hypothetical protein